MKKGRLLYLFLTANVLAVCVFWWLNSGKLLVTLPLLALGRLTGLLLALSALFQVILIGRVAWVEKAFGLDQSAKVHRIVGYSISGFLLAHPILLGFAYAGMNETGFWPQIMDFIRNYSDVFAAVVATLLFLAVIAISIVIIRRKLKYETWYWAHLSVYAAIALAFGHQTEVGGDLQGGAFLVYWYALYAFVFGNLVLFRFLKPIYLTLRHGFAVRLVDKETEDSYSIYIGGKDLKEFHFRPGQFLNIRFLAKGYWTESHPFSISSFPNGEYLRVTVRDLGDFTEKLGRIPEGTRVFIDGPHGAFTKASSRRSKALFIAGGVGITPIRPLLEEFAKLGRDVLLLYGSRKGSEIIFKGELDALQQKYKYPSYYIISDDQFWPGERGRIDAQKIKRLVPDIADREVYICGPTLMMESLVRSLESMGVKREDIHYEEFSF